MKMSGQEIEFDDLFREEGGIYRGKIVERLSFHSSLLFADKLIEKLKEADEAKHLSIYVDIIDNYSLNACVSKKGEKYYIGINIGVLVLLSNIIFRIFSSNSILTEIGDATKERDTRKIPDAQVSNIQKLLDDFNEDMTPKDETRLVASSFFFKSIFEFLVFHEYAHIISGHVDYYIATNGICKLFELESDIPVSSEDVKFRHAMELLADEFAVFGCMRFLELTLRAELPINPILISHFNDWGSTLRFWYLPIYTFFRLFGHLNKPNLLKTAHHPIPIIKSHLILESIDHYLENYFDVPNHEDIAFSCFDSALKIERAFAQISEQGKDLASLKYILTDEATNYAKMITEEKDRVNIILKKYAPVV